MGHMVREADGERTRMGFVVGWVVGLELMAEGEWDASHIAILGTGAVLSILCLVATATLQYVRRSRRMQMLMYHIPDDSSTSTLQLLRHTRANIYGEHELETEMLRRADTLLVDPHAVNYRTELVLTSTKSLAKAARPWLRHPLMLNNSQRKLSIELSPVEGKSGASKTGLSRNVRFAAGSGCEEHRSVLFAVDEILDQLQALYPDFMAPLSSECEHVRLVYRQARWYPNTTRNDFRDSPAGIPSISASEIRHGEYLKYMACIDTIVSALSQSSPMT